MEETLLKGKTLLVVDDETDLRDIVASELEFMGASVFQAENISAAQKILSEQKIDLIVSDIRMPGGTGIDLLDIVKAKNVTTPPVLLITGFADITIEDAFHKGAEALMNKPFMLDDLIKLVARFSAPNDDRYKEKSEVKKTLTPADQGSPLTFGRGGFSLEINAQSRKVDIGEQVGFEFKNGEKTFSGQAVCRWYKTSDTSQKVKIGLEVFSLEGESLEQFKKMPKSDIPYIPAKH